VVWVGYFRGNIYPYRGAVCRFDGATWTVYNRDNSPLPHEQIYDISVDWNDNPWISCASEGMAVVLDNPTALGEEHPTPAASRIPPGGTMLVRGVLMLTASSLEREASGVLLDATGRRVTSLRTGANDVSGLAPGVYFLRLDTGSDRRVVKTVMVE
jgi:hypothetical protein